MRRRRVLEIASLVSLVIVVAALAYGVAGATQPALKRPAGATQRKWRATLEIWQLTYDVRSVGAPTH
ncbi:MAG TPA: hypothetical protein VIC54_07475 [Terriglobales bacterium]